MLRALDHEQCHYHSKNHAANVYPKEIFFFSEVRLEEVQTLNVDRDQKRRRDLRFEEKRRLLGHEDQFAGGIIQGHFEVAKKTHP